MNSNQRIVTPCTACQLHETCYTVGMKGIGQSSAPLKIFLDYPPREDDQRHKFGESKIARFIIWMCNRNNLFLEDGHFQINFTLKCSPPKNLLSKKVDQLESIDACSPFRFASLQNAKAILTMGALSCLAFTNRQLKERVNCDWKWHADDFKVHTIPLYVTYAPGYCLEKPGETVGVSRMIYYAAEAAGLQPKFNKKAGFFDFGVL